MRCENQFLSSNEYNQSVMRKHNNNPIISLFEAVAYPHRKGCEKLRIMAFVAPSGMSYRICVSSKTHFDGKTGFVICTCDDDEAYRYSTGQEFVFFNDDAWMEDASIGEIADKLLSKYHKLEKEGNGKDEEYAARFLKLLEKVKEGKYPCAFADYGYDIFEEGKIYFLNSKETNEYAPPGDCDYRRCQ